jgi:hypothetical protein
VTAGLDASEPQLVHTSLPFDAVFHTHATGQGWQRMNDGGASVAHTLDIGNGPVFEAVY